MINNITIKQTHINEDIPDFLAKLRLYLQNQEVNPADNAEGPPTGKEVVIGYLRRCMKGRALEWFDKEIITKQNWELANLLDNTEQANLVAINRRTAVQIGNQALNEALGQPGNAIVKLRAVEGSRPTNIAVNAPNANNGTTVVVAGIHFGQAIWWLKTHFPTVEEELQDLQYGTIRKENMTIDELYRKLLRIGRQANYRPKELHNKFLDALPIPWFEKAKDISKHLPLDELAKKLYEIELQRIARHKRDRIFNSLVSQQASREIYEPLPISASQQQRISLEDMQKAIQYTLQSVAQKAQAPASQTVEPVRQPRGPPPSLQTEKGIENYNLTQYLHNLDIFSTEDFNRNFPIKHFQKPCPGQLYSSNQNARIDRIESKVNEISQMTSQFRRMMLENQSKKPDEEGGYNKEENKWHAPSHQPEIYNELLPKLSLAMRKMCQFHIVQEKESKSDEWFSSLQYLHCNINDLLITNSFLDSASEFGGVNDATINALRWKADKPSDFAIKGNSKHISESLGYVKDKDDKIVMSTENFAYINNGEPKLMLCLGITWIQKVQGIFDPSKNQFRMKLHEKTYTIPTFSKTLIAKDLPKEKQILEGPHDLIQVSIDFSSLTSKVLAERCSQLTETKMEE
ncbi:8199_t:CDS:2 [Cetraspora pellucida]|uniref:8199_t:CDS:1 n=1 Tax=Cetraspora pellucida TaxID=1433469 RepID=A0A9N9HMP6_9GLOM|nr:8199_t:CDS:2 [Cetraspora pellucida]